MSNCKPRRVLPPKGAYLPFSRTQNPAPKTQTGQEAVSKLQEITSAILRTLIQVVPSNYVSQTPGPSYILQYQAFAEQLAKVQLALEETGLQSDVDFTSPEFLWQMIGTYVVPNTQQDGIFEINGDLTYRSFLASMIHLLLQGSTLETIQEGLDLLTDGVVTILEKVRHPGWDWSDQFTFEVNVQCAQTWSDGSRGELGTGFPEDPIRLLRNNQRILRVLRPASTLYDYRHLFLDSIQAPGDAYRSALSPWFYDDWRRYCCGRKRIRGTAGVTWAGKLLFSDVTRSFGAILPGATLEILSGPNARPTLGGLDTATLGRYRVSEVLRFPGVDSTPRAYVTSPSNLQGTATILDDGVLEDSLQDFSMAAEGEVLTIQGGPLQGSYRLETILGPQGGPVGFVPQGQGATRVRVAPSILRLATRTVSVAAGQTYEVVVERLGVRIPFGVLGEDASPQTWI